MCQPEIALEQRQTHPRRQVDHDKVRFRRTQDGIVILVSWRELLGELRERLNPQAARQVVVERGDRLAEEDGVVGPPRITRDEPAPHGLEVEPPGGRLIEGGRQAPRGPGGGMDLTDVGEPHRRRV